MLTCSCTATTVFKQRLQRAGRLSRGAWSTSAPTTICRHAPCLLLNTHSMNAACMVGESSHHVSSLLVLNLLHQADDDPLSQAGQGASAARLLEVPARTQMPGGTSAAHTCILTMQGCQQFVRTGQASPRQAVDMGSRLLN